MLLTSSAEATVALPTGVTLASKNNSEELGAPCSMLISNASGSTGLGCLASSAR